VGPVPPGPPRLGVCSTKQVAKMGRGRGLALNHHDDSDSSPCLVRVAGQPRRVPVTRASAPEGGDPTRRARQRPLGPAGGADDHHDVRSAADPGSASRAGQPGSRAGALRVSRAAQRRRGGPARRAQGPARARRGPGRHAGASLSHRHRRLQHRSAAAGTVTSPPGRRRRAAPHKHWTRALAPGRGDPIIRHHPARRPGVTPPGTGDAAAPVTTV
jgi:hypothetical protein